MATTQDSSVGFLKESTYGTGVTPSRWVEHIDENFLFNKSIKQGMGLRVGSRAARSGRRVVTSADGGGDLVLECASKGMGTLLELLMGTGTSTLVSGTTYQQLFTLADAMPSATIQVGLDEVGGTIDAYTFTGAMCESFEFDFGNDEIAQLKATFDTKDLTTATGYVAPTYPSTPNLFHFANATIASGTLTSPTTTVVGSGTTSLADVRGGSIMVNHNLATDRYNIGGSGRKAKPTVGLRDITGTLNVEYDNTTFRDAVLNDTPMMMIVNYATTTALSVGFETFQVVLPEIKFDGDIPTTNGTDLIVQTLNFRGLDNLTAAQPIWIVTRTSDAAL